MQPWFGRRLARWFAGAALIAQALAPALAHPWAPPAFDDALRQSVCRAQAQPAADRPAVPTEDQDGPVQPCPDHGACCSLPWNPVAPPPHAGIDFSVPHLIAARPLVAAAARRPHEVHTTAQPRAPPVRFSFPV